MVKREKAFSQAGDPTLPRCPRNVSGAKMKKTIFDDVILDDDTILDDDVMYIGQTTRDLIKI